MKNTTKLIGGTLFLVALDMISKYLFYDLKYLSHTTRIRPSLNTGISRSLPVPYSIIIIISILGTGAFLRLYTQKQLTRGLAMVLLAGTIGNMIDRIIYGGVRDFINIGIFDFPIFNIADILLSIGVLMWMSRVILEKKK